MNLLDPVLRSAIESWLLAYLLNSLWQVPLVYLAAVIAARLARPAGPRMEHRVWVGALLLQVALPVCSLPFNELWQRAAAMVLWLRPGPSHGGQVHVLLDAGYASGVALPLHTSEALAGAVIAYLGALLYFAGRLAWRVRATEALRRNAQLFVPGEENEAAFARLSRQFGFGDAAIEVATSAAVSGPATVGILRPILLLPPHFLDRLNGDDFNAVLAHEFAHMRRADFAKNLLYGILSLPIAYHPLAALTRARLAETRELLCDEMAADAAGGREVYARSLLRLARMLSILPAPRALHAIGILDANIFERRVMYLTRKTHQIGSVRRLAIVAACAVVALAACTSALALRMEVKAAANETKAPARISVKADQMKLVSKTNPVYPVEAKKARVSGTVILGATIGKDGAVENLRVVSGPHLLQSSALDAVRSWRYQPFLLNGDPVKVETKISVIYTLAG